MTGHMREFEISRPGASDWRIELTGLVQGLRAPFHPLAQRLGSSDRPVCSARLTYQRLVVGIPVGNLRIISTAISVRRRAHALIKAAADFSYYD